MKQAQQLEPVDSVLNASVGMILYLARRFDQALEELQKALEIDPNHFLLHFRLGLVYLQKGMLQGLSRKWRTLFCFPEKGDSFPEANFLDEFLMKSSGLLSAFAPIFSEAAAKLVPIWLREPCRLPYSWR
jgi:tetratricopeptide (TPR) repeat protein